MKIVVQKGQTVREAYLDTRNKIAAGRERQLAEALSEVTRLRELAKKLSDTLLKVAPLGGSECFVRVGEDFYADTEFFSQRIRENQDRLHEAMKRAITAERALDQSRS
jgi:hypothetical protein